MKKLQSIWAASILLAGWCLMLSATGFGQSNAEAVRGSIQGESLKVPAGQEMKVEGVVLALQGDNVTVRSFGGGIYDVTVSDVTDVKEKKSNPFRGAKKYSKSTLMPGLQVEVKGSGDSSGSIDAREIRFRKIISIL